MFEDVCDCDVTGVSRRAYLFERRRSLSLSPRPCSQKSYISSFLSVVEDAVAFI
jgi:hypothetical protein